MVNADAEGLSNMVSMLNSSSSLKQDEIFNKLDVFKNLTNNNYAALDNGLNKVHEVIKIHLISSIL
jgi:hypothetical protein